MVIKKISIVKNALWYICIKDRFNLVILLQNNLCGQTNSNWYFGRKIGFKRLFQRFLYLFNKILILIKIRYLWKSPNQIEVKKSKFLVYLQWFYRFIISVVNILLLVPNCIWRTSIRWFNIWSSSAISRRLDSRSTVCY